MNILNIRPTFRYATHDGIPPGQMFRVAGGPYHDSYLVIHPDDESQLCLLAYKANADLIKLNRPPDPTEEETDDSPPPTPTP